VAASAEPIRAVLFDWSGTLHSQASLHTAVAANVVAMAANYGVDAEALGTSLREAFGTVTSALIARPFYLTHELLTTSYRSGVESIGIEPTDDDVEADVARFWDLLADIIAPNDGAVEALEGLRARGVRCGVVSVNDERELQRLVDRAGLRELLDFVLSSEEARSCKPDPVIFLRALELARAAPTEALFVGDLRAMDVVGANRAGLRSVLLVDEDVFLGRLGDPGPDGEADHEITSLVEVVEIVDASHRAPG